MNLIFDDFQNRTYAKHARRMSLCNVISAILTVTCEVTNSLKHIKHAHQLSTIGK